MSINSIRTLFVTMMSYPPIGGEFLRNWQNINMMTKFGPVGVFSIFNRENNYQGNELEFWHHYNTTTQSPPSAKIELGIQWLHQYGLTYYCPYLSSAARELDDIMTKFQPDVVVLEQIWLYHYLPIVKRHQCQIIFDNHNIEAPLYEDTKCSGSGLRAWARKNLHLPQIKSVERELIYQTNQVWLCSQEDDLLLKDLYGAISHSYVVPNSIDISYYNCIRLKQCSYPTGLENKSQNFLFLGNFFYVPNTEAAQLLIEQIYPRLRQTYPNCRLLLVGRGATQFMREAAQKDSRIIVTGEVPDVRPYLAAASVMLVPLNKGGGTRFKILEAFAAGCPVVSSTKGAEGLNAQDGKHLLIRDEIESIVDAVIQLWSEPELGQKLVDAAYEFVQSKYSWEAVGLQVEKAIKKLF